MTKNIKNSVAKTLIMASIIPLFIFSFIFLGQTFQYFIKKDTENIKSVLGREQKYLEYLVEVNIKDMLVVSTSDNIKTQKVEEIMEVCERVMKVRNDFYKMKYVRKDGYTIEVVKGKPGVEYTKTPLGVVERLSMDKGEFALYSDGDGDGQYIVFSAPYKVNGQIEAVVLGYLPADRLNFITSNINLSAVGDIFIKDSRGNILIKHGDISKPGNSDLEYNIKNTDWVLSANIDYSYFEKLFYENILVRLIIFLTLVVIFIVPFSVYGGNRLKDFADEIIENIKSLKKIEGIRSLYKLEELDEFRKSFNKSVDIMNNNIKRENDEFYVDKLTGLYNKMYIEDRLVTTIYERHGEGIYFLMLDVSDLSGAGEMFANLAWDVAMAEIGETIREGIRFRDIAIRFAEYKFLVILGNTDHGKTMEFASRLKGLIRHKISSIEGFDIKFVVKIGISRYEGDVYKSISSCERALNEIRVPKDNKIKYRES